MQEQHQNWIQSGQLFKKALMDNPDFQPEADKIKKETKNLPKDMRTPTPQEIKDMALFAEKYKRQHPKASERNCRRAMQRKFNVTILPNTD